MTIPDRDALLCRAIRQKGQTEAQKILTQAEKQAQGIVQDAKQQVNSEFEQHLAKLKQDAFQQAKKLKDGATLKARQMLLHAKEDIMQQLLQETRQQLDRISKEKHYPELLQSIVLQAIRELPGNEFWIQVRQCDQPLINESFRQYISEQSNKNVHLLPEPKSITGGCLAYSYDKRLLVDFSFSALLTRSQPHLRELLAREMVKQP